MVSLFREVACLASDRHGSNFESCFWRTVASHSSHHHQEVLPAQFSPYVHTGGLIPRSFHFISFGIIILAANCKLHLLICKIAICVAVGKQTDISKKYCFIADITDSYGITARDNTAKTTKWSTPVTPHYS